MLYFFFKIFCNSDALNVQHFDSDVVLQGNLILINDEFIENGTIPFVFHLFINILAIHKNSIKN